MRLETGIEEALLVVRKLIKLKKEKGCLFFMGRVFRPWLLSRAPKFFRLWCLRLRQC